MSLASAASPLPAFVAGRTPITKLTPPVPPILLIVTDSVAELTQVTMLALSEGEIARYVATGEPMDKAGAYGIQGLASRFVERIDGSYTNVVGLPVSLVYRNLRKFSGATIEASSGKLAGDGER